MNRKKILFFLLVLATLLLTGCNMRTIDQMYCLPKRSENYLNLQSAIDNAMVGLEYHAPISGEHQQPVQMFDLNGDGDAEYLVFARGSGDKPLKVLIFTCVNEQYVLADTLEGNGTAFEQVQYVRISGRKGYDFVISRQVSDQVVRPVSVYSMVNNRMELQFTTNCAQFICSDLDRNGFYELLVLRPGEDPAKNGVAELYSMKNGTVERSHEVALSQPADRIKRITTGKLNDDIPAVYVASDVDGSTIITDVYALVDEVFTNVSLSSESGTSVQTLRNYYVFADDIDNDGVLELPNLIPMQPITGGAQNSQYLIRWFAMNSDGSEVDKRYTYHSFAGGWYLELSKHVASNVTITQLGNSYEFTIQEPSGTVSRLMTIYVFTGQLREEQAVFDNRFVLGRTESTVFAARLNVTSAAYDITPESLIDAFHFVNEEWKAGES